MWWSMWDRREDYINRIMLRERIGIEAYELDGLNSWIVQPTFRNR